MLSPTQLAADLRPAFRGELFVDAATRAVYSTDASPFQVMPLAVAVPLDEADVQAVVKFAVENGLFIVPRGAGTGQAGESLGAGIVLDMSVHFRGPPRLDGDLVHVLPGLTITELNATLAPYGRRFAPNPANANTGTIGGALARDASGPNAAVHGYTHAAVHSLRVIWDSAEVDDMGDKAPSLARSQSIADGIAGLLRDNLTTILGNRPRTPFDRCGYALEDVISSDRPNLRRLLVGSEGTLGIIVGATLQTVPMPGGVAVAMLGFQGIDDAARAGVAMRESQGLVACEILDRRHLAMGRGITISTETEAVLILTAEGDTASDAVDRLRTCIGMIDSKTPFLQLVEPTSEIGTLESFKQSAISGLYAMRGGSRPIPVFDDVGVPPESLPDYIARVQSLLRSRDVTASIHAHSQTGVVHVRPLVDLNSPSDRDKLWPLADAVYGIALDLGGTISAQSGVGLSRTPWVRTQSAANADLFREVKRIFDPKNLFNPGKIVGPDPTRPAWPLRPITSELKVLPLSEANACNSCGDCRPRTGRERMCPVFKATGLETATPRAKAQLVRMLDDPELLKDPDAVRAVAKQCVNCKMCREECRANVDIPRMMNETKAQLWREHGTDRANWFLARAESLVGLASSFTFTSNTLLGSRWGRWLLSRIFGLDPTIRLPAMRYRSFMWRAWTRGWTRRRNDSNEKRIALFVDPLTNATDPLTGEAAVAVLKHNGAECVVVSRARPSGFAALTAGDVDTARAQAKRTVRLLAEYVSDGYRIVCLDPNSAIAITQEYPTLFQEEDADVPLVIGATVELMTLLWQWHGEGKLNTDFREQDLWLGHHIPCHVKALRNSAAGPKLLSLIPGVHVQTIDAGCSGMAGPWGLLAKNRSTSLAAGEKMIAAFSGPDAIFGSSECGSCRIQMQDATGKRAVHPIQYLAMAYGLLPEVGRRLVMPLKDRVSR